MTSMTVFKNLTPIYTIRPTSPRRDIHNKAEAQQILEKAKLAKLIHDEVEIFSMSEFKHDCPWPGLYLRTIHPCQVTPDIGR